jgi:hypothetical protein
MVASIEIDVYDLAMLLDENTFVDGSLIPSRSDG